MTRIKIKKLEKRKMLAYLEGVGSIFNLSPIVEMPAGYYHEHNPDLVALENDALKVGLDFSGVISRNAPTTSKRRARRMRHVQFALDRRHSLIKNYAGIEINHEQ